MNERLRIHIGEVYDGSAWEKITPTEHKNGQPFELWLFDRDVEFEGETWRCIVIQRVNFDTDDTAAVDYAEDIYTEAWGI